MRPPSRSDAALTHGTHWLLSAAGRAMAPVPASPPSGPAFSVVLLLHVASAVVGFGAMVITGVQAARVRRGPDAPGAGAVVRYFRPGVNWLARVIYLVPVLGLSLIALSRGAFGLGDLFVDVGLGVWLASVVVAELVLWPGERRIQRALLEGWPPRIDMELDRVCRHVAWTAPILAALFIGAAAVMVIKP